MLPAKRVLILLRYIAAFALTSAIVVVIIVAVVVLFDDGTPAVRPADTPAAVRGSLGTPTSSPRPTLVPPPHPPTPPTPLPTARLEPTATSVPISRPDGPANVRYIYRDGDGRVVHSGFADSVRVSWEPVGGADYYKVYARAWMFDEQGPQCQLNEEGRPLNFCELVIGNLKETTYEFESPANLVRSEEQINRHWVAACNRSGCSDLVLAVPGVTGTSGPAAAATPAPASTRDLSP